MGLCDPGQVAFPLCLGKWVGVSRDAWQGVILSLAQWLILEGPFLPPSSHTAQLAHRRGPVTLRGLSPDRPSGDALFYGGAARLLRRVPFSAEVPGTDPSHTHSADRGLGGLLPGALPTPSLPRPTGRDQLPSSASPSVPGAFSLFLLRSLR